MAAEDVIAEVLAKTEAFYVKDVTAEVVAAIRAMSPADLAELIGGEVGWATRLWSGGIWEHQSETAARDDAARCNEIGPNGERVTVQHRVVGPWMPLDAPVSDGGA